MRLILNGNFIKDETIDGVEDDECDSTRIAVDVANVNEQHSTPLVVSVKGTSNRRQHESMLEGTAMTPIVENVKNTAILMTMSPCLARLKTSSSVSQKDIGLKSTKPTVKNNICGNVNGLKQIKLDMFVHVRKLDESILTSVNSAPTSATETLEEEQDGRELSTSQDTLTIASFLAPQAPIKCDEEHQTNENEAKYEDSKEPTEESKTIDRHGEAQAVTFVEPKATPNAKQQSIRNTQLSMNESISSTQVEISQMSLDNLHDMSNSEAYYV